MAKLFLGIKQVTYKTFSNEENKTGYLWFVRKDSTKEAPEHLEIYLGETKYGEINDDTEVKKLINKIKESIGLTDDLELPDTFEYDTIIDGIESALSEIVKLKEKIVQVNTDIADVKSQIQDVRSDISSVTINVEEIRDDVLENEYATAKAISILRNFDGLDTNFNIPEGFNYNNLVEALEDRYTKEEIDNLIKGAFKFKGVVKYKSDLDNIETKAYGDVYQVIYENEEKESEGVKLNSEFVWTNQESGDDWVELGPLFDADVKVLTNENIDSLFDEE